MPPVRSRALVGAVLLVVACSACSFWRAGPVNRATLIGNYVFRSVGGPPIHDPDRLTLKADGKYVLIRMPGGHPGPVEKGTWQLYNDPPSPTYGSHPILALGTNTYPIEVKGKTVRLLVNDDLGYFYEKTVSPRRNAPSAVGARRAECGHGPDIGGGLAAAD
jgi:hypothetical protein